MGATYYSYQREWEIPSWLTSQLVVLRSSFTATLVFELLGWTLMIGMSLVSLGVNRDPEFLSQGAVMMYLLLVRPLFVIGFTMVIVPVILGSSSVRPLGFLLAHEFWVPFSRLSYGAYLCNEIFMLFHNFNTERGTWASSFDAILFFFAFVSFSFFFSFMMSLLFDLPCRSLYYECFLRPKEKKRDAFYHS